MTRNRAIFSVVLTIFVLIVAVVLKSSRLKPASGPAAPVTMFVAADLHYLSPDLTDHGSYFQELTASGDGKAMEYCEEITESFVEQVISQSPDVLILAGDLTFNGEKLSHAALTEKLRRIEAAGIPVLVLPGNHDLENPMAASFQGTGYTLVEGINEEQFETLYWDFGLGEAVARDPASLSYVAELSQGFRILMQDVNTVGAPGTLTDQTLRWAEQQLKDAARQHACVVAVSHQNLLSHNSLFSFGFVINNREPLLALYEKYGVICNLSGHMHVQHIAQSENGLPEIATSSLLVSPNQYGVLSLDGTSAEYHTAPALASASENEEISAYAKSFLWDTSYRNAAEELGSGIPGGERMKTFFADVNSAYFSGRMDAVSWDDDAFQRWKQEGTFLYAYLQSILDDGLQNYTQYTFTFDKTS